MSVEDDLSNCHFLPISLVEKIVNHISSRGLFKYEYGIKSCRKNLLELQKSRTLPPSLDSAAFSWNKQYNWALNQAISSHDWNKLYLLLTHSPIWEHNNRMAKDSFNLDNYLRALIILLMYHPSAKSQSLLEHFKHMVLSCRNDEDKKALMKLLVALPEKYLLRSMKDDVNS